MLEAALLAATELGAALLAATKLEAALLEAVLLAGTELGAALLEGAVLEGAVLEGAVLEGAVLEGARDLVDLGGCPAAGRGAAADDGWEARLRLAGRRLSPVRPATAARNGELPGCMLK